MKIAVIVAMDKEMSLVLDTMSEYKETTSEGLTIYKGKIGDHDIVLSKCGIGKVNSALNTFRIIKSETPDLVINSGVAGGAGAEAGIGDVLIADKITYHDVWCGPGTQYGAAEGLPVFMRPSPKVLLLLDKKELGNVKRGLICSGDKFISKASEINEIKSMFPDVMAVDMESASIAQTAILCGVEFAVIRVVSDTPGKGENLSQYKDFWQTAPSKTFEAVKSLIECL